MIKRTYHVYCRVYIQGDENAWRDNSSRFVIWSLFPRPAHWVADFVKNKCIDDLKEGDVVIIRSLTRLS